MGYYATAKMAEIIEKSGKPLSEIVDGIKRTLITRTSDVFCPYLEG